MNITNLDKFTKHPSYLFGDEVAKICAPLFCNFPINYFCYTKWRKNGGMFLSSDKNWLLYYIQGGYHFLTNGKKIHSWSSDMEQKPLAKARHHFNYHNGIIIEKPSYDYTETLEFASPNQYADPLEFCYNKDLLNNFFSYFKYKASTLIEVIERSPVYFPWDRFLKIKYSGNNKFSDLDHNKFCDSIKRKRIHFNFQGKKILFSRREFDVLNLLVKGKNMVEIAKILKISRRTVETYLYDAKNKSGAFTVSQLLESFIDTLF